MNGIATFDGGNHVEFAKQVAKYVKKQVDKGKRFRVTSGFINKYLFIFVSAVIDNPTLDMLKKQLLKDERMNLKCRLEDSFLEEGLFIYFLHH